MKRLTFTRLVLLVLLGILLFTLIGCDGHDHSPKPESQSKIGPYANLFTVEHDDHLFVVYSSYKQGGLVHHPDCLEKDLR